MKTIEIKGKYGRDRLIIKKTSKNYLFTGIVDDSGAEFVLPIKDML
jgi:hypothetical protein